MKNMKNIIWYFAVLLFGAASCQKISIMEGLVDGTREVQIRLNAPAPLTKAIGDGEKAKDVYLAAFVDGESVPSLCQQTVLDEDGTAVLDLNLVKNVTYRFVFWAQCQVPEGEKPYYDLSSFYVNSVVKADYAVNANDDKRDAFCAVQDVTVVRGTKDVSVTLARPFAQINFASADYEMLKQLGLHNGMHSEMTVVGLPDTIKLLDGSVSSSSETGTAGNALFSLAPIPSGDDEYINVRGQDYGYIGMNYVLASEYGDNVSVKGRFVNGDASWETTLLSSVPIRSNYKTNILGELFSEHGQLSIIIEPGFTSDEVVLF